MTTSAPSGSNPEQPAVGRRTVLQAAALGLATLTSCSVHRATTSGPSPSRTPPTPSGSPSSGGGRVGGRDGALSAPPPSAWSALARSLHGDLVRPGDADYDEAKELFNTRWDSARPAAVVEAAAAADVATAIAFARKWKLGIRPKAGGHSYVGASTGTGALVVSTARLSSVGYDAASQTVSVGAGARLYPVHQVLDTHGRTLPTGTCPTVGATGLTLGGGLGVASRQYGLSCDQLYTAQIVTADGVVRTADATTNPDLLWALRGGGGGNFGIVTLLGFHTQPATSLGFFLQTFPWSSAAAVIRGWSNRVKVMPPTTWANLHVEASTSGSTEVRVVGVCLPGHEAAEAQAMADAVGVRASDTSLFTKGYLAAVQFLGGGTTSQRQGWAAGSDVLPAMTVPASQAIVRVIAERAAAHQSGVAILDPLTGAVQAKEPAGTAFPWRRHLCSIQWYLDMPDHPSLEQVHAAYTWIATAHKAVASISSGGYVNYLEPRRAVPSYYGANLSRLQTVKRRYDPSDVFAGAYAIPS